MTEEQAIKIRSIFANKIPQEELYTQLNQELAKEIDNAIKKQIPKRVRVDDDSWYCCRNCGETFSLANTVHRKNKYCGSCGQALDWGDCE